MSHQDADILYQYLRDILYNTEDAKLDINSLSEEFRRFGEGLAYFGLCIQQMKAFSASLAAGNLEVQLPPKENELASPLKSLHASLKHLTWQTQQIAKGDYQQKVSFMGEFASSFNMMTKQLSYRRDLLLSELNDMTQKAKEDEEYAQMMESYANIDTLTGLYSRYYGMRTLKEWMDEKRIFQLCFIDLDNLKYVNDTFGHLAGDDYIVDTANLLKNAFPDAVIVRLGGDEFMLLIADTHAVDIEAKLSELRIKMQSHIEVDKNAYFRSLSYGTVYVEANSDLSVRTILSMADEEMYKFKRRTRAQRENLLRKYEKDIDD